MNDKQYCQLLQNRRLAGAQVLFGSAADERVLRSLARRMRRREQARSALEHVLPTEWLRVTHVEGLERGTLGLAVSDAVVCERIRRAARDLETELGRRVPGFRRLRVMLRDAEESGAR